MKVEIKTTYDQLLFLNQFIANNLPVQIVNQEKEVKSLFYLITEIATKILKKTIDKKGISKPFKLPLKYYEAYALHQFILTFIDYEAGENKRVTREILGKINKELT
ncbi:hypothetical protein [Flavobacterium psychrophilum]|uniref:hypothetical protein n=1 Tax=Flavobacterium psychrophilum TaxID=96345 RepID=UPI0006187AD0|nr:hypothetical protein [Flavobacterium psychrophilum]OAE90331.1 hypothetical protein SU65_11330 [Flavobacterium psychrophilum]